MPQLRVLARIFQNIKTQQQQQQQREVTIDISIAYFMFIFIFVPILTLFSDNISYYWFYVKLLFINNDYLQNFHQYHKTSVAAT